MKTVRSLDWLSLALSDYLVWHTLYRYLPHLLVRWIFFVFTTVQLYWLGAKYLLVEFHRKFSSSVRKLTPNEPDIPNQLHDYIAIVTGASSPNGIGFATARELARRGCTVVVTSFGIDSDERRKLAQAIGQHNHQNGSDKSSTTTSGSVHVFDVDFRDLSTVCDFVARFNKEYSSLDLLVNNAGVMYVDQGYTVDGFELHYQINYLSHALLTWLLMPALNRADKLRPARIVNVSSSTHYARDLFLKDLQSKSSPYSPFHAYAQSKLCVLMLTYYLADWLDQHKDTHHILINTLHPGVVNTHLYQNVWWARRFPAVAKLLFRPPEEGAETVLYAALSTEVESSGHYYEDCRRVRSSRFSYRKSIQKRLAQITAEQLNPIIEKLNYESIDQKKKIPLMFT